MRKIVAGFACSLDGFIEGASGEMDWILIDSEIDFAAYMSRFDAFLYGRRSYEAVIKMGVKPQPGSQHYVVSNTLEKAEAPFILLSGSVKERITGLKQQQGKDIALFGGATLLASLLDLQLVDEISVSIIPVLLARGRPMVDLLQNRVWLQLKNTKSFANGTVQINYTVTYQPPT